uniref:Uncharacterized protein n=1 Tax=Homalodisca liturata TaxID=320908 RepID=A0A1B6IAK3_9HEMI
MSSHTLMILQNTAIMISLVIACSVGDLYDFVVQKDEEVREVLTGPEGKDKDLYSAMKSIAASYDSLTKHLQARNMSVLPLARRLYDRGVPEMILEVFFLDDLRRFFNWQETEINYFHSLYSEVQDKWQIFEREYWNTSLHL